jgi:hypothetical protein
VGEVEVEREVESLNLSNCGLDKQDSVSQPVRQQTAGERANGLTRSFDEVESMKRIQIREVVVEFLYQ